jgi:hypothetical protein
MTRLVVEEGGKRRAFKVGDGVITIGSGAGATLKLASPKVAEVHAEIVVQGGHVRVRPKPGVLPPTLKGRPQTAEFAVPKGATIVIGDAKLSVDPPDPSATPAPPPSQKREEWQRTSRELYKEKGLKPQHGLLIAAPVVIVIGALLYNNFTKEAASPISAMVQINRAADNIRNAMYGQALADLDAIVDPGSLDPAAQARIAELRKTIADRQAENAKDEANAHGSLYWDTQILKFEKDRLEGKVEVPAVRVFLKRLEVFRSRWPDHPEAATAQRKRDRYADVVDLSKPPTYEDIEYEVELLTWGRKGDYAEGRRILDAWLATAEGEPRAKGLKLLDKKIADEDARFDEVMKEARHQYEKKQIALAVDWLVVLICNSSEAAKADQAAEQLLLFERLAEILRGYRTSRPETWPELSSNAVIARWIKDNPL